MRRPRHRRSLLLLWSANGEPVARIQSANLRSNAPFVMWDGKRYDLVPRQSETAFILHYQTHALVVRYVTQPVVVV